MAYQKQKYIHRKETEQIYATYVHLFSPVMSDPDFLNACRARAQLSVKHVHTRPRIVPVIWTLRTRAEDRYLVCIVITCH